MALTNHTPSTAFLGRTRLKRTGGSLVMVVPAPARDLLELAEGQEMLVSVEGGKVVMEPVATEASARVRKPKYTLEQLLAGMEETGPSTGDRDWVDAAPTGRETW